MGEAVNVLAGAEVPEVLAGLRIGRHQVARVIAEQHHAAGR
jgi:hypothetical protein